MAWLGVARLGELGFGGHWLGGTSQEVGCSLCISDNRVQDCTELDSVVG